MIFFSFVYLDIDSYCISIGSGILSDDISSNVRPRVSGNKNVNKKPNAIRIDNMPINNRK
jgi:hypothetical protein